MRSIDVSSIRTTFTVASTLAALCLTASAVQAKSGIVKTWPLTGGGPWDYMVVDPAKPRLFIARSSRVDVVSTQTGELLGSIADTNGVHGIALAQDLHRGYASNGKGDSITVFDLDTLKTLKTAPVPGHNPDAIVYEPTGKHVFTFNGKSKDITVFDAETLALVKTLPVGEKPEFAVDDGAGKIYVNLETDPGKLAVIDTRELKISATWPLPDCNGPSGLALDTSNHRLFSVCDEKTMAVTDALTGKQVARVKIGDGPDAVAYDAARKRIFASNFDGTMTIVQQESPDTYTVLQNVATKRGARTMALDPASGLAYTVSGDLGAPPAATPEAPHAHPAPLDGTEIVMVIGAQ